MKYILNFLMIAAILLQVSSCKKDDDNGIGPNGSTSGSTVTASFTGTIRDTDGNIMTGVIVTIGNKSSVTDANGIYNIMDVVVEKERAVITAERPGYWSQQRAMIAVAGTINYADLEMYWDHKMYSFNGGTGGAISMSGGTTITFPANAIVTSSGSPYSGLVRVTAHEISTADSSFSRKIPGGDLLARDIAGNTTLLLSYGMAGAKLYDPSGNSLQMMAGKSATIKFPIATAQLVAAPATIPLWHFDENTHMWQEEGSAVKTGNFYEGTVTHFSWWNCDIPCENATLTMNLTGCQGTPLVSEIISIQWNSQTTSGVTGFTGSCSGIIPANAVLTVTCHQYGSAGSDTVFTIGPFSSGSNNSLSVSLPNLNCDRAIIQLSDCSGNQLNGSAAVYFNSSLLGFYSTQGGNIYINNIQPGTYIINSVSGFLTGIDTVVITPGTPLPLNLTMQLCDSVQSSSNELIMVISNSLVGTINLNLFVTEARYEVQNGYELIHLTTMDLVSGDSSSIEIYTPGYVAGLFSWNTTDCIIIGYVFNNFQFYGIHSNQGSTNINAAPTIGGIFNGSFSGLMMVDIMGMTTPSNVSATFNTVRTQ